MASSGRPGDPDALLRAVLNPQRAHAGAWLYIQEQDRDGLVSFVGASRRPPGRPAELGHPFRFGSARTHQFIVGSLTLQPELVVATDTLAGMGLGGLATHDHDVTAMLRAGEILIGFGR